MTMHDRHSPSTYIANDVESLWRPGLVQGRVTCFPLLGEPSPETSYIAGQEQRAVVARHGLPVNHVLCSRIEYRSLRVS